MTARSDDVTGRVDDEWSGAEAEVAVVWWRGCPAGEVAVAAVMRVHCVAVSAVVLLVVRVRSLSSAVRLR